MDCLIANLNCARKNMMNNELYSDSGVMTYVAAVIYHRNNCRSTEVSVQENTSRQIYQCVIMVICKTSELFLRNTGTSWSLCDV